MSDKVPIRIEDITSYSMVPYTIFDEKGKILSRKGDVLNSRVLNSLSLHNIYRLATSDDEDYSKRGGIISRISKETTDFVINFTKEYLDQAEKGQVPSIQGFMAARDRILSEVMEHISKIEHIGELRVYDDDYNLSHGVNVATLSTALGIKLDFPKDELKELTLGALLHDIGKIKIPKIILNKPNRLSVKEFEIAKLHAPLGYKLIREQFGMPNNIAVIALQHQERYDGSGYVRGLQGEKIHKYAHVVSVADVYDASSSDKVYSTGKNPKDIIKELLKMSKCFEPRVLFTLVHMVNYNTGDIKERLIR